MAVPAKSDRLAEFLRRLEVAPRTASFEEAYEQLCALLNAVEDGLEVRERPGPRTDDAVDRVALLEQQLGEVRAILARDPGDERAHHAAIVSDASP